MKITRHILPLSLTLSFTACVTTSLPPAQGEHRSALAHLKAASQKTLPAQERAALYLASAKEANDLLASPTSAAAARQIYNKAAAELTVLLRESNQGSMWNRSQSLTTGTNTFHLHFAPANRNGVWPPHYFTSFQAAEDVPQKSLHCRNLQTGIGGALVGVRKTQPLEHFSPLVGISAPVTATLNFKGRDVTLTLLDPSKKPKFPISGTLRTLDADFSAPLAYYPQRSEYWNGIMGAIRVDKYMKTTGLYMLQPYDPDRIPLIFVHGLISTPQMWRNVINELERDPKLRGRYQCWVFGYPTGNPPTYSALRFREELTKIHKLYPKCPDYVLVGHSMGGLVSRMQAATLKRESWDKLGKDKAAKFFANVKMGDVVERSIIFQANPKVDRIIFICTPHRGSELALGKIGELGMRLISLPGDLTSTVTSSLGSSLGVITGDPGRMPSSVTGLSPNNPTLKVLDSIPIQAAYHTIAGDEGKGDTPQSSDGIVPYWSSHLHGTQSEKIVPGPHGSCELPETLDELRRILLLHLQKN